MMNKNLNIKTKLQSLVLDTQMSVPNALYELFSLQGLIQSPVRKQQETKDINWAKTLITTNTNAPSLKNFRDEFSDQKLDSRFYQDLICGKTLTAATSALRYRNEGRHKTGIFELVHQVATSKTAEFALTPPSYGHAKKIVQTLSIPSVGLCPTYHNVDEIIKAIDHSVPNMTECELALFLYSRSELHPEGGMKTYVKEVILNQFRELKKSLKFRATENPDPSSSLRLSFRDVSTKKRLALAIHIDYPKGIRKLPTAEEILQALDAAENQTNGYPKTLDWATLACGSGKCKSPKLLTTKLTELKRFMEMQSEATFLRGMYGFTNETLDHLLSKEPNKAFSFVESLTEYMMKKDCPLSEKGKKRLLKIKEKILIEATRRGLVSQVSLIKRENSSALQETCFKLPQEVRSALTESAQNLLTHGMTNTDFSQVIMNLPLDNAVTGKSGISHRFLEQVTDGYEYLLFTNNRIAPEATLAHKHLKLCRFAKAFSNTPLLKKVCPNYFDLVCFTTPTGNIYTPYVTKQILKSDLQFEIIREPFTGELFHKCTSGNFDLIEQLKAHGINPFTTGISHKELFELLIN